MSLRLFCLLITYLLIPNGHGQSGLKGIQNALNREHRIFDKQVDWSVIHRSCPHDKSWVLHLPSFHLYHPIEQSGFTSGQFESSLYATRFPKRFLRRRPLLVTSIIFDHNNKVIGTWEFGLTTPGCGVVPALHADEELLARIYHDSIPITIGVLRWRKLYGYVYKTERGWYMVTYEKGVLRHEPFLTLLREHWTELVADGKYAKGPWLDD